MLLKTLVPSPSDLPTPTVSGTHLSAVPAPPSVSGHHRHAQPRRLPRTRNAIVKQRELDLEIIIVANVQNCMFIRRVFEAKRVENLQSFTTDHISVASVKLPQASKASCPTRHSAARQFSARRKPVPSVWRARWTGRTKSSRRNPSREAEQLPCWS